MVFGIGELEQKMMQVIGGIGVQYGGSKLKQLLFQN